MTLIVGNSITYINLLWCRCHLTNPMMFDLLEIRYYINHISIHNFCEIKARKDIYIYKVCLDERHKHKYNAINNYLGDLYFQSCMIFLLVSNYCIFLPTSIWFLSSLMYYIGFMTYIKVT